MTDPKPRSIPDWQKDQDTGSESDSELKVIEPKPAPSDLASEDVTTTPREELLTQATSWLDHEHIRNAPLEGKVSFLEGKGLTKDEIDTVLGLSDPQGQSAPKATESTSPATREAERDTATPESRSPHQSESSTPPVITYPEFLMKAPEKAPLISRTALLRTAYGSAIVAGALHFTSKYLVEPMFAELSHSRHQLHETAFNHLECLNTKLTGLVSEVPLAAKFPRSHVTQEQDDDAESEASDPAEMFHRDIGVQTSDPPTPTSSSPDDSTLGKIDSQAAKLQAIRSHLGTLHGSCDNAVTAMQGIEGEISKLDSLLDELKYARHSYGGARSAYTPAGASWMGVSGAGGTEAMDEIDRVKAEIKGVKGVLLSSRSFPRTGRPMVSR